MGPYARRSLPASHTPWDGDERSPVRGKGRRSWRRHDLKRLSVRMWAKGKEEEVKPHRFLEWVWWDCELSLQIWRKDTSKEEGEKKETGNRMY